MIFMVLVAGVLARGADAAPGRSPTPEESDFQAAEMVEGVFLTQVEQGGDATQAGAQLDRIFAGLEAKYPGSAAVRDEHGNYLWALQRKQEAFLKWQEAEKLDGNNADVCLHLGSCWLENGDTHRATGYFEKASALAPKDALLHFHLGNDLYLFRHELAAAGETEGGVVDRALRELRTAAELEPGNAIYAKGYADTFYSIPEARWPEAIKAWQHLYDISDDKDVASINLARVSLQMKDKEGARRYLEGVRGKDFEGLKRKLSREAEGGDGN